MTGGKRLRPHIPFWVTVDRVCPVSARLPFFCALLAALWLGLSWPAGALADEQKPAMPRWELSADSITHQPQPRRVIAEGDVVISRPEGHENPLEIRADRLVYDPESGVVEAHGRVRVVSPTEELAAGSVTLDLESQTGTLEQATVHLVESGLYLKGEHIEKTGEETYYLEDAWLSACRPEEDCREAWSFKSKRVHLTVDGLAHIFHPRFQVKEVPAIYSPYVVLPANIRRQSGFLFPEVAESSRHGFEVGLPYFFNLSPSADATLYSRFMDRRGLLGGAEFRYAAAAESRGMFQATFLRDSHTDSPDDDYRDDGWLRDTRDRYWVRGKVDHDFGDDLLLRLDLDLVSDQDFIMEFDDGIMGYNRSNRDFERMFDRELLEPSLATRQSTLQLRRITPSTMAAGELMGQQDSRHDLRLDNQGEVQSWSADQTPLQALPRLHFSGRSPVRQQPFSLSWSSEYVHYWRREGVGAQRLDLHPQLIAPLPRSGGWTEGRATVGVRQTMYQVSAHGDHQWEHDRYQDRTAFDFEANLATTLVRDFDLPTGRRHRQADVDGAVGSSGLEHMVRPNLIYTYNSRSSESRLPDLDSVDNLERKNWLTYELNNYFELFGYRSAAGQDDEHGGAGDYWSRSLAFFKVMQTYDIDETRRDDLAADERSRELSDLRFDLRFTPVRALNLRYQTNLSMYGEGVNRHELQGTLSSAGGFRLAINYRNLKYSAMREPYFHTTAGDRSEDIQASFQAPVGESLTFRGLLKQSLIDDHIAEASFGLTYQPHCWAVDIEVRRHVEEKRVMVIFSLDTIGEALNMRKKGI